MSVVDADDPSIIGITASGRPRAPPPVQSPAIAPVFATPLKPAGERSDGREMTTDGITGESNLDDDEMENCLSVAAIEADKNALLPIDAAIQSDLRETTTRVLASLTPREERIVRMRFGLGMNSDHAGGSRPTIFSNARANSADRGEGTAETQTP